MNDAVPKRVRLLAGTSLFLWASATTAGRLLAYTYNRLTSQDTFFFLTMTRYLSSVEIVRSFTLWLDNSALSLWVTGNGYLWPTLESIHFLGLSLLIGTVGLFDLRLMGFARNIEPKTLHRLVPIGVLGYGINLITGTLFFVGDTGQYVYNDAFHFKMLFMFLTGINVVVFYLTTYRHVEAVEAGGHTPTVAKVIGGISLVLWLGVITCGRLLTFYRP